MKYLIYFIYLSLLVLFILASVTNLDVTITQHLYNSDAKWAILFQNFGSFGAQLLALFAIIIICNHRYPKIMSSLIFVDVALYLYRSLHHTNFTVIVLILISLICALLFTFLIVTMLKEYPIRFTGFQKEAVYFIIIICIELLLVNLLKTTIARPRYITQFQYVPWYQLGGINLQDSYHSFPSGHVADTMLLLGLLILPVKNKHLYGVFIALYIIAMAISRIVLGMHYVSDVVASILIVTMILFMTKKVYYRIKV